VIPGEAIVLKDTDREQSPEVAILRTDPFFLFDSYGLNRTETWHYDAAGNMDLYKAPADLYQTIVYDSRNRPVDSSWNNYGMHVVTAYDPASRVTSVVTNGGETAVTFGYDDANRQIWEEQALTGHPTRRVERRWNEDGLPESLLMPALGWVDVHYTYNQRNQIERINDAYGNYWFKYDYDPSGNMTKRQNVWASINNATQVEYDQLNRPTVWENRCAGDAVFARSRYQYDNVGREVATWRDEQSGKGERYWYNATNQLMNARYNADQVWSGTAVNPTRAVDYQYEAGLNRTWMNDNGQTTSYTVNWMNQYIGLNWVESLYDQNFNLYTLNGWRYDYDADKHLVLTTDGTNTGEFVYDGLGRCVKRTINGVATIITYDAWKPTMEWDGNGNLSALNVYGPGADEILYRYVAAGSQRFRYHHDIHGNVTFLLDWAGDQIIEKYTYDAFGKPTILSANDTQLSTSAYGNRFMFQGREYLSELGIYDYRHRMYNPALGRFLQTDPTGFDAGDMNLFRYCGDDPVDGSDPTGLYVATLTMFGGGDWSSRADGLTNLDVHRLNEGKIVDEIRAFEKSMNEQGGDAKVKWSGHVNEIHDSNHKFGNGVVATTDWDVASKASSDGGKIAGFGNDLRINIYWNDSSDARSQLIAQTMTSARGEFAHARDAFYYGANPGYRKDGSKFASARAVASGVANRLVGTNTPSDVAEQQMVDALRPWRKDSQEASKRAHDWPFSMDHVY
jgi:RHS repeat-associated protein